MPVFFTKNYASMKNKIAGIILDSYRNFLKLDKRNERYWKEKYKQRTGKGNARGWNNNPEYQSYLKSRERRAEKLREENPSDFLAKYEKIRRGNRKKRDFFQETEEFGGVEVYNAIYELDTFFLSSKRIGETLGKPVNYYMVYMPFDADATIYSGENAIKMTISEIAKTWRRFASDPANRGKYGLLKLAGELSITESEIDVLARADLASYEDSF